MSVTYIVLAVFAVLLTLEWRYRQRLLRLATALLALAVLAFFRPDYTTARRRALSAPPAERVVLYPPDLAGGVNTVLSDYHSGVYTTMRWVGYYHDVGAGARLAAIGALFWLALFHRGAANPRTDRDAPDAARPSPRAPEA